MKTDFLTWTKEQNLLAQGDTVLLGVSGGIDSMCLLSFLKSIREEMGLALFVCHVNHGIRGELADRDEAFVRDICAAWSIPCKVVSVDVPAYAKERKMSLEEAARVLRYRAFSKVLKEIGGHILAVAHHADDQAETMLFRMARGTGIRGLAAMRPKDVLTGALADCTSNDSEAPALFDEITLIRPLLAFSRAELEAYIAAEQVPHIEDETNADLTYRRNRIRHTILPELREISPKASEHLGQLSRQAAEVSDYMEEQGQMLLREARYFDGSYSCKKLSEAHIAVLRQAVYRLICDYTEHEKDITGMHVEAVLGLISGESGHSVDLPYEVTVRKSGDRIYGKLRGASEDSVGEELAGNAAFSKAEIRLSSGEESEYPIGRGRVLRVKLREVTDAKKELSNIPKETFTKWFDYDKIATGLCLRTRTAGDWIPIHPNGGSTRLQDFLVDAKIPVEDRDGLPILCDGERVVWVIGYRTGEAFRVDEHTKRILECFVEMR